jgi:hypothetical protein
VEIREIGADAEKREVDTTNLHSIQEAELDSLAGCESETYGSRIHCCLVASQAGRPLYAYRSVRELLEVLRDAVAGHKSPLEKWGVLHRDISENDIIITGAAIKGDPKGMLINTDLAKELDSLPWSESPDWHYAVYGDRGASRKRPHVPARSRVVFLRLHMDVHSIWMWI